MLDTDLPRLEDPVRGRHNIVMSVAICTSQRIHIEQIDVVAGQWLALNHREVVIQQGGMNDVQYRMLH